MGDIALDKAKLIALVVQAGFYGIFVTLFMITIWILLNKSSTGRLNVPLLSTVCVLMAVATAHIATDVVRCLVAFIDTKNAIKYYSDVSNPLEIAKNVFLVSQTVFGDSFAVYRCWVVWGHSWTIIILPTALVATTAVSGYVATSLLVTSGEGASIFQDSFAPWIHTFFITSLITNLVCTALIAWRIWRSQRSVSKSVTLLPAIQVIIESGALYSTALLALIIAFFANTNGQYIAVDLIVPLIGVTFSMVIVRVSLGVSSSGIRHASHMQSHGQVSGAMPSFGHKAVAINVSRMTQRDDDDMELNYRDPVKSDYSGGQSEPDTLEGHQTIEDKHRALGFPANAV